MGDVPSAGARRYGDETAVAYRGSEQSYDELETRSNRLANALVTSGIESGERVGIYMENNLEWLAALFGVIKSGAVAVPLNFRRAIPGTTHVLADAGIDTVIGSSPFAEAFEHLHEDGAVSQVSVVGADDEHAFTAYEDWLADRSRTFDRPARGFDDVALQCYTSGTTGDPKGVPVSHRNLLTTLNSFDMLTGTDPETGVVVTISPLFHMMGLTGTALLALYTGRTLIMKNTPEPDALLDAITEHGATDFAAVPTIYMGMVRELEANPEQYDIDSIDSLGTGAAPLPDDTRRKIEGTFGVPLGEGWGTTETAAAGTTDAARGVQKGAGCIGQPIPGVELKLVDPSTRETRVPPEHLDPTTPADLTGYEPDFDDEPSYTGEIAIRGPQIFEGYHDMPEQTAAAFDDEGWFYTKDIARVDEDRFLWMVDRADDMLVVGGENVYPAEVEDELFFHPAVAEAAVVAAPHETKGEAPVAYVVTEEGDAITEDELRRFALDRVASYAHPRRVFFVDELPKSATQKVQRYKLEERVEADLDGPLTTSDRL
ncbi:long-chain fatty acid--CoA ligase [Halococcus dombrowskii]